MIMWKNLDANVCLTTRMQTKRCPNWISLVVNEMNDDEYFIGNVKNISHTHYFHFESWPNPMSSTKSNKI